MKIALINTNLVAQTTDLFTTGIVYMPVGLAYFAGAARATGFQCEVIDAFGEKPQQCWVDDAYLLRGLTPSEVAARIDPSCGAVVVYAANVTYFRSLTKIIRATRRRFSQIPIIVMENTQAVTAYSLRRVQEKLYDIGADYVITGESEERGLELLRGIMVKGRAAAPLRIDGIGFRLSGETHYVPPSRQIGNLDALPFPAWDLFPLRNYWSLKYAHGPVESSAYLPLLTSRGCPYACQFCVIPETNAVRWRGRSAENVVDEIENHVSQYGVKEFHVEDVDPTVDETRIRDICAELIRRRLEITWKICAGTKAETLRKESTIELMAMSGCRYLSFSPESGSERLLRLINKPSKPDHVVRLAETLHRVGIFSQACFILGYPGETAHDRALTRSFVRRLIRAGVDEIALFIVTPVPGSAIFDSFDGYQEYSQLTFSPKWRRDYAALSAFRIKLYLNFLLWKLCYQPLRLMRQPLNFIQRRFETKMEMAPYRALHTMFLKASARRGREPICNDD